MDQYKAYFHHTELGSATGMFVFPFLSHVNGPLPTC